MVVASCVSQKLGTHTQGEATMAMFTVSAIIDGDTFEVSGGWKWNGETGTRVRPTGYDAAELHAQEGQSAKTKLHRLIYGKQVELRQAHAIDRGRLVCDVFLGESNLADLFQADED
jgi:endonuclease YncB( thermonuclease family)